MEIRKVKRLIELLEESNIAEIEIKEGEQSVRISRHTAAPAPVIVSTPVPVNMAAPAASIQTQESASSTLDPKLLHR